MIRLGLKQIGSIGDASYLSSAAYALKQRGEEVIIEMHLDNQCKSVAAIFEGIAKIEFTDNPVERLYIINKEKVHSSQRVLNSLDIKEVNCIPKFILKDEEIIWSRNYLKQYNNPIIVINDNAGGNDANNICAQYKRCPIEKVQEITDYCISKGHQVLQFGPKDEFWGTGIKTFTPLREAIHIRDLTIRQQMACFSIIKKLIGQCSGLLHLMLGVGGKCAISIPDENPRFGYNYWDVLYTKECWGEEKNRVLYVNHRDFLDNKEKILAFLNENN